MDVGTILPLFPTSGGGGERENNRGKKPSLPAIAVGADQCQSGLQGQVSRGAGVGTITPQPMHCNS